MNHFDIKSRQKERAFFRKLRTRQFQTGSGKRNEIVEVTNRHILFITRKSKAPQRICRRKLRKAMTLLYYRRTLTRRDLGALLKCNFNSALLGLLRLIFLDIARIHKAVKGGLMRITLLSVRHFFSGAVRAPRDLQLAIQNGARFFLISYAHVRHRPNWHIRFEELAKLYGIQLLIDSGAFTVHQAIEKGKAVAPITAAEYADFLERYKHLIYGFFTLDVIGDPIASRENTDFLRSRGLQPIEVFHFGTGWDELECMVASDQEIIAIGGTVGLSEKKKRCFFQELFARFPGQLFHLLGCGSPLILEFPFFSSDSSTWLLGRKFKIILTPKQVLAPDGWTGDDCIAHIVRFQSQYEDKYERGTHMQIERAS